MRDIRFRAWDKEAKQFEEENGAFITQDDMDLNTVIKWIQEKYILMQYTGLHDKQGKEIYEGDIVGLKGFRREEVGFTKLHDGETGDVIGMGYDSCWEDMEVIGNIYENPELLK